MMTEDVSESQVSKAQCMSLDKWAYSVRSRSVGATMEDEKGQTVWNWQSVQIAKQMRLGYHMWLYLSHINRAAALSS